MLHSPDDLNLLLKLTLGITAIKPGFKSQLIQQSLIMINAIPLRPIR